MEELQMSMRIRMMDSAKNQMVIEDETNKVTTFQSYKSLIAEYNEKERTLVVYPDWDYSKTTMKYFKQFCNDYTLGIKYETKEKFLKMAMENEKIMFK